MIDQGRGVLYGELAQIKNKYRASSVSLIVDSTGDLAKLEGVASIVPRKGYNEMTLSPGTAPQKVLDDMVRMGMTVNRFEVATPSLNEIFIEVAGKRNA
jgi:ABC-2 type transport system ATP-binding protein